MNGFLKTNRYKRERIKSGGKSYELACAIHFHVLCRSQARCTLHADCTESRLQTMPTCQFLS